MFHKITNITPLEDYTLLARFSDGTDIIYDMKPLFPEYEAFRSFETVPGLFALAKADVGGYGIVWNEDVDIDAEEIWQNGEEVKTPFSNLLAMSDATELWHLNESTLRKAIAYGKLKEGIDVCKFGKQWVVSKDAMIREYGLPAVEYTAGIESAPALYAAQENGALLRSE